MGIKLKKEDTNTETNYIQGYVEYQSKKQRELAYIIESVEPLGYLLIPGPKENKIDHCVCNCKNGNTYSPCHTFY